MAFKINEAPCPRYSCCHSHTLHPDGTETCDVDGLALTPEEKARGRRGNAEDVLGCAWMVAIAVGLVLAFIWAVRGGHL